MRKQEIINAERQKRLEIVNALITEIASCGRKFFAYKGAVAQLFIRKGKVYYKCEWISSVNKVEEICLSIADYQNLKGWYHGGTLKALILDFKRFVMKGHDKYNYRFSTYHWGYSNEDSLKIYEKAIELGYLLLPKQKDHA